MHGHWMKYATFRAHDAGEQWPAIQDYLQQPDCCDSSFGRDYKRTRASRSRRRLAAGPAASASSAAAAACHLPLLPPPALLPPPPEPLLGCRLGAGGVGSCLTLCVNIVEWTTAAYCVHHIWQRRTPRYIWCQLIITTSTAPQRNRCQHITEHLTVECPDGHIC